MYVLPASPAPLTAVVGLADGFCGYCPTIYGLLGGGYSGEPTYWTRLEPYAGYRIVEAAGAVDRPVEAVEPALQRRGVPGIARAPGLRPVG